MIRINENFNKLQASYLFSDIAKRVAAYEQANPEQKIIKLGIGDVTHGLPDACIQAFHQAVDEMATDLFVSRLREEIETKGGRPLAAQVE